MTFLLLILVIAQEENGLTKYFSLFHSVFSLRWFVLVASVFRNGSGEALR